MIFVDRYYLHFVSLEKKKLSVQLSYWLCQTAKYQRKKIEKKKELMTILYLDKEIKIKAST